MDSYFEIVSSLADGSLSVKAALIFLAFYVALMIRDGLSRLLDNTNLLGYILDYAIAATGIETGAAIAGVRTVGPAQPPPTPAVLPALLAPPVSIDLQPPTQAEVATPDCGWIKSGPYCWEKPGWAPEREPLKLSDITNTQRAGLYEYLDNRLTTTQKRALRQKEREEATAAVLREISADRAKENAPTPPAQIPRASFLAADTEYEAAYVTFTATFGAGAVNSISRPQSKERLPGHLHADLSGIYMQEIEPVMIPRIFDAPPPPPPAPEPTYGYVYGVEELTYDLGKLSPDDGPAGGYITTTTLFPPPEDTQWWPVQSTPQPGSAAPVHINPVPFAKPTQTFADKGKAPIRPGDEPTYGSLNSSIPFAAPGPAALLPINPIPLAAPIAPAAPSNSGSVFGESVAPPTRRNRLMKMSISSAQMEVDNIMTKIFERIDGIRNDPRGVGEAWKKVMASQGSRARIFAFKYDIDNICDWAVGPHGRVDESKMPRSMWESCRLDARSLSDLNGDLYNGWSHEPKVSEFLKAADRLEKLFQ